MTLGVFVVTATIAGVTAVMQGQIVMTDSAGEANLNASHLSDELTVPGIQEWMTGGLAVGDFNNDGSPDIFYVGGGLLPDRLFINDGTGVFADETADWQLNVLHCGNGVSVADYDDDGWMDIYVTSFGAPGAEGEPGQHRLYHNNGDGTFTNVADAAGVSFSSFTDSTGFGSAWGDYDLDGNLDLFVASWWASANGNRLFRNNGDGTFTDVTSQAIGAAVSNVWGFQPAFADMNGDLWPEILLAADFETSRYLVNNGNGTFTDVTVPSGTGLDDNGMGQTVADVNNDGRFDWYVTSVHSENPPPGNNSGNMLYIATGAHIFSELSVPLGANDGGWGWGTIAVDLDQDTWIDIVEVNGRPAAGSEWELERAKLFRNLGNGAFNEQAEISGLDSIGEGRGLAYLDADDDGDLDLIIANSQETLHYFTNETAGGGWLIVRLDTSTNDLLAPHGFGARVDVVLGETTMMRPMNGSPSYLATSELMVHFGVGAAKVIDRVEVHWARGQVTVLENVARNQDLTIAAPVPGDLNADGAVGVEDLLEMLSLWGPISGAHGLKADLDDSRVVDVIDLLTLLAAWGS